MRTGRLSIRVLQLKRVLELASVAELPGVSPRTIELRGNRLDNASSVEINSMDAPGFVAIGSSRLLVQVPPGLLGAISDVAVFSDYLIQGGRSVAFYDLGSHPGVAQGKYRALQNFVKLLLTTPGTDIFSPGSGGGFQTLLIRNVSPATEPAIAGEIESRTMSVARQVIQAQALDSTIPPGERLLSATIDNIIVSPSQGAVSLFLSLAFHDGEKVSSTIGW